MNVRQIIKNLLNKNMLVLALCGSLLLGASFGSSAVAVNPFPACATGQQSASTAVCQGTDDRLNPIVVRIINALLYLIGIIAVIMIIVGGLRYVLSNGDSGAISGAKSTVLYAVVGLVVAILAFAIVNFVVDRF